MEPKQAVSAEMRDNRQASVKRTSSKSHKSGKESRAATQEPVYVGSPGPQASTMTPQSGKKKFRKVHRKSLVSGKEVVQENLQLMFGMDEFTPLALAVHERNVDKVERLLTEGADPNIQLTTGLFRGCIALHLAALYGDVRAIDLLIRHNSKLNEMNIFGETALDFAKEQGQDSAVECLLLHRAKTGRQMRARLRNHCILQ